MLTMATEDATFGQSPPAAPVSPGQGQSDRLKERNQRAWEALRLRHAGESAKAAAAADTMLRIERDLFDRDHLDRAGALEFAARMHENDAAFGPALEALREAIAIRQKVSAPGDWQLVDDRYAVERLGRLSELDASKQKQYREVLRIYDKASTLGKKAYQVGEAIAQLRRAAELLKTIVGPNHPEYATALDRLGKYEQMSVSGFRENDPQRRRVEALFSQAREIRLNTLGEKHPDCAVSLENLFACAPNENDPARANSEPLLRRALEIRGQTQGEAHPEFAQCLRKLAYVLEWKPGGHAEEAAALYQRSLRIVQELFGPEDLFCDGDLQALARLYRKQGDLERAEGYLRRQVEYARQRMISSTMSRRTGWIGTLGPMPDVDELRLLNTFTAMVKFRNYASTLHELAVLRGDRGDVYEAGQLMIKCMETHADGFDLSSVLQTGFELDPFSSSVQTLMLSKFLTICLDQDARISGDEAYGQALAWKGAYLARDLRGRRWRARPQFAPLFNQLEKVAAELAKAVVAAPNVNDQAAWDRIRSLTARKDELEGELTRRLAQVDPREKPGRSQVDELKSLLPRDGALIDFREFQSWKGWGSSKGNATHLMAFVIRPQRPVLALDLGPAKPIHEAIGEWRERVDKFRDPSRAADRLRQLLWKPLEPHLDGVLTLLVSPDGELCRFPLAALPGETPGAYLVERLGIATVPVPQLLVTGLPFEPSSPSLLIVGDVDFDAQQGGRLPATEIAIRRGGTTGPALRTLFTKFPPLPGTRREIERIRGHFTASFKGSPVTVLKSSAATEQQFRQSLSHPRFIHLATHGFFIPPEVASRSFGKVDNQNFWTSNPVGLSRIHPGLLSGITLAGANRPPDPERDDGILTAVEAQHLDLAGTDLVVLSACESAIGTSTHGEGLMGLQRAFQVAGARSLVSSLWQVDDEATASLMDEFYLNLWERQLPKIDALRQAQLTVLRRYAPGNLKAAQVPDARTKNARQQPDALSTLPRRAHPFYWAAFTLSGDWH